MRAVQRVEGSAVVIDRRDIDTDQIIPAAWLKRVERTGFGAGLFEAWRADPAFALNAPAAAEARILVAGANFGCGSSREHAVWALQDFGFEAVAAPSFADIFYVNCTKNGLLPVILDEQHGRALAEAGEARIDVDDQTVTFAGGVVEFEIDADVKHRLLRGLDDIALTLRSEAAIDAFEASGGGDRGPVTTAL